MMDVNNMGEAIQSAANWCELSVPLREFASKHPLPNIVKITKGQYRNIGVAKTVHNELYLHSISVSSKVLAECVRLKEGKSKQRHEISEQKYSLPTSYQGWFEVLSEDGNAVKPLTSVSDLTRLFPSKCLVREMVKAYLSNDNGDVSLEKSRHLPSGEVLTLVSESGGGGGPFGRGSSKKRLLRCLDSHGETIYLAMDVKGVFSPVAGAGNISGVHQIKGLLEKFRLPLLVRLVHGIIPSRLERTSFTGVFRLVSVYTDETAFVYPLKRDAKMVPVSTREPIKVQAASNFEQVLEKLDETAYFHRRSAKMLASYFNSIHILVSLPDPQILATRLNDQRGISRENILKQDSKPISKEEEEQIFDEVDDIYAYVRDGGPPPKPKSRAQSKSVDSDPPPADHASPEGESPAPKGESPLQKQPATAMMNILPDSLSEENLLDTKVPVPDEKHDWEEPIYEQIDKFQRARGKFEDLTTAIVDNNKHRPISPRLALTVDTPVPVPAAAPRSPMTSHPPDLLPVVDNNRSPRASEDGSPRGSKEDLDDRGRVGQVSSLRELYKQKSMGDATESPVNRARDVKRGSKKEKRGKSLDFKDPRTDSAVVLDDPDAPPVPPKRFDAPENGLNLEGLKPDSFNNLDIAEGGTRNLKNLGDSSRKSKNRSSTGGEKRASKKLSSGEKANNNR